MGVEDQVEAGVGHRVAMGVGVGNGVAVDEYAETLGKSFAPVLLAHLRALVREPCNVFAVGAVDGAAEEPAAPAECRVGMAEGDQPPGERMQFLVDLFPVEPGEFVVLAVGVVVAVLGAADFVPRKQHGYALRQHQGDEDVALLARAQGQDIGVVGGAFYTAVPGAVVVGTVAVVLAVGFVVLVLVGHQVAQGEAVVGGDEVDAGIWITRVVGVQVGAAGEAVGELGQGFVAAAPEVAQAVAVLAVPFRPSGGKIADLVAAFADVPRLGNQFDLADHGILLDQVEEGGQPVHIVQFACQRGGEVETEAVHVHFEHPVAQRIHDQLQHVGMAHVEAVAGAAVVHVAAAVVFPQPVVIRVVDALETQHRAVLAALGGVVVDHVEDDLEAGLVQRLHHLLEFGDGGAGALVGRVVGVRREVGDRVVAPVVAQSLVGQVLVVHKVMHRHQLDGGDAQALQVPDRCRVRKTGIGAAQFGRHLRVAGGEALDVQLVNDGFVPGPLQQAISRPIEDGLLDDALGHERRAVDVAAHVRACGEGIGEHRFIHLNVAVDGFGVGIEQQLGGVAAVAVVRLPRAVHAKAVALPRLDLREVAVPAVAADLRQVDAGFAARFVEQAQFDALGDFREQREIGAAIVAGGAERVGIARPDFHVRGCVVVSLAINNE